MRLEHLLSGEDLIEVSGTTVVCIEYIERKMMPSLTQTRLNWILKVSPIAQLVRALH